jgi:inner membrane protein
MSMNISPEAMWLIIGMAGLIAEVVTGGFWMAFLGAGAIITSILMWAGLLDGLEWQIVCFVAVSGALIALFRKKLLHMSSKGSEKATENPVGQIVRVVQDIPAQGPGQVEYQGAPWSAFSEKEIPIPAGARVAIVRHEGLKIWVKTVKE